MSRIDLLKQLHQGLEGARMTIFTIINTSSSLSGRSRVGNFMLTIVIFFRHFKTILEELESSLCSK